MNNINNNNKCSIIIINKNNFFNKVQNYCIKVKM